MFFILSGNALHGKTITNKEKYTKVCYVDENKTSSYVNDPLFQSMTHVNHSLYEVQTQNATIKHDLPMQIGFWVYQLAKKRMLEFYYDYLLKFFDRSRFELAQMDTDSLYLALSAPKLTSILKPESRATYFRERHLWEISEHCDRCIDDYVVCKLADKAWKLKPCCLARQNFDRRTPGLFKVEFEGEKILALCSKSYICVGRGADKKAHKGVNSRQNDLRFEHYEQVLDNCSQLAATNKGIRMWGKSVNTYQQTKVGLTSIYVKRKVLSDGVSTLPLDL